MTITITAINATTPPTIPMIRVSSVLAEDPTGEEEIWSPLNCLFWSLVWTTGATVQIISGSKNVDFTEEEKEKMVVAPEADGAENAEEEEDDEEDEEDEEEEVEGEVEEARRWMLAVVLSNLSKDS